MLHASLRRALPVFALSMGAFTACHARAADAAHPTTPTLDVEIDDRGPGAAGHVARMTVGFVNGKAKMSSRDGQAHYDVDAELVRSTSPHIDLSVVRGGGGDPALDLNVRSSMAAEPNGRVVVARIDRVDGHVTMVTAHLH